MNQVCARRSVKDRLFLDGGWVVSITIPDPANDAVGRIIPSVRMESFTDPAGKPVCYAKFSQNVKGGYFVDGTHRSGRVFFHLHHEEPMQFVGKSVVCIAEVFRKVMNDDSSSIYVDLKLAPEGAVVTHRINAMPCKSSEIEGRDGFVMFETPDPLTGNIVVAPVGVTIVRRKEPSPNKAAVQALTRQIPTGVKRSPTTLIGNYGDEGLKRYTDAGWEIRGESDKEVFLTKDGGAKQFVYQRPHPLTTH